MKRSNITLPQACGCKAIRDQLSPEWLRDCVMLDAKNKALVVSPKELLKHGYTNLLVTQGKFGGRTIFTVKLDFDLLKIKRHEPIGNSPVTAEQSHDGEKK